LQLLLDFFRLLHLLSGFVTLAKLTGVGAHILWCFATRDPVRVWSYFEGTLRVTCVLCFVGLVVGSSFLSFPSSKSFFLVLLSLRDFLCLFFAWLCRSILFGYFGILRDGDRVWVLPWLVTSNGTAYSHGTVGGLFFRVRLRG